jgi:cytidylate kinase
MGESGRVILEGRDAGTVIFPDAELKIYLDADPEERGRRRHREQQQRGTAMPLAEVVAEIKKRDHNDSTRAHSPLQAAPDARVIDTSGMDIDQVAAAITSLIEEVDSHGN